jgi:hypothetical protein
MGRGDRALSGPIKTWNKETLIRDSTKKKVIYESTWYHNPEDHGLHFYRHENLKFHLIIDYVSRTVI